jgi:hypothetical protein
MKNTHSIFVLLLSCLSSTISFSQDTLITNIAKNNHLQFSKTENSFKGPGWDLILKQIKNTDFVLIGEDHFTNEIPYFFNAITSDVKFDNFFCEVDQYSAKIIKSKIEKLSKNHLDNFISNFGNTFSFFSQKSEFDLLSKLVESKTEIFGIDQISIVADRLICSELKISTKNKEAKKIYEEIESNSKTYFDDFLLNQKNPFYIFTDDFEKKTQELLKLKISKKEIEIVEAMRLSSRIYKNSYHHLRVQYMKNQLMNNYDYLGNKKNLFKFGAYHLPKGESILEIFDIGNLVNNIADSKFKTSLHILIIDKSGTLGSPFKDFPEQKVDIQGDFIKSFKPFFEVVNGTDWSCFDMIPFRNALNEDKIKITDNDLKRVIKGYDLVIIIPVVTASKFNK